MTVELQPIVGYFLWNKGQKGPVCAKVDADIWQDAMPETIVRRQSLFLCSPIPLTSEDWGLSLDELTRKYPCPKVKKDG